MQAASYRTNHVPKIRPGFPSGNSAHRHLHLRSCLESQGPRRCPPTHVKVHGGGWYDKDDVKKTITLYGESGDYGEPKLSFLDRIPRELRDYKFYYTPIHGLPGNELDLSEVEWF